MEETGNADMWPGIGMQGRVGIGVRSVGTGTCLGFEGLGGKPKDLDCGLPKLPRWVCGGRAGVGVRSAPAPNPVPHAWAVGGGSLTSSLLVPVNH